MVGRGRIGAAGETAGPTTAAHGGDVVARAALARRWSGEAGATSRANAGVA
jgi:hypothetical protein